MRTIPSSTRPHGAVPRGTWRRLTACLAVAVLLAQAVLSVQPLMAMTMAMKDAVDRSNICSAASAAAPEEDGLDHAGGQPAAAHVHCPVCTAAPGAFAPPPPALTLAAPPPRPMADGAPMASFDVAQPPYLTGPPGHAPPARA